MQKNRIPNLRLAEKDGSGVGGGLENYYVKYGKAGFIAYKISLPL
jgi:hypothetical protein